MPLLNMSIWHIIICELSQWWYFGMFVVILFFEMEMYLVMDNLFPSFCLVFSTETLCIKKNLVLYKVYGFLYFDWVSFQYLKMQYIRKLMQKKGIDSSFLSSNFNQVTRIQWHQNDSQYAVTSSHKCHDYVLAFQHLTQVHKMQSFCDIATAILSSPPPPPPQWLMDIKQSTIFLTWP